MLLIEQDVTRALEVANRGYFLNEGTIALEGMPSALLANDAVQKATLGVSRSPEQCCSTQLARSTRSPPRVAQACM